LAERIQQLHGHVGAVYLTRTDAPRARTVQRLVEQAGGPPVLTSEDATAIALSAAALAYLHGLGRDPSRSRILIAAAVRMPILSALLIAVGFPDITLWNTVDGAWFPLRRVARDADVVIDLSRNDHDDTTDPAEDREATELDLDRPEGSVITRRGLDSRTLAAPGLLRALAEQPRSPFLGLRMYGICAGALAHAAPRRGGLHSRPAGNLTPAAAGAMADAIAEAVTRHLTQVRRESEDDPPRLPIDQPPHPG
jgi:malate dehydrogenase (oxaloacetate-decarboxylating)